jgi:NAD(P)-dependent dehydrogenase (short-subunit alcohol dehydrogenase family)
MTAPVLIFGGSGTRACPCTLLRATKVRVNALAPTLTRTPLAQPLLANETIEKSLAGLHPLGRLGEPEDIAALGALLLGPEGACVTGQVIAVDGGRDRLRGKD